MELGWFSAVFASVISACLVLQAVLLFRFLWTEGLGTVKGYIVTLARGLAGQLRCCWARGGEHDDEAADPLAELTRKEVDTKRVLYARRCIICLVTGMSVISVAALRNLAIGLPRQMSWSHDLVFMCCYLIASALLTCPALTAARTLNVWHCAFMLFLVLDSLFAVGRSAENVEMAHTTILMGSIFFGIMNLSIRISFFTNLTCLVVTIYNTSSFVDDGLLNFYIVRDCSLFAAKVGLLVCWELALVQGTRLQIEAKSERGQRSAVISLLGKVCDSVVELDEKLSFVAHVPTLASALFHGSGKSLQGEPFKRLICEGEDQKLFEGAMRGQGEEPVPASAHMFHTKLRDAWGNSVAMEVFHVPFLGVDDHLHHLLGLKEHSDTQEAIASTVAAGSNEESAQTSGGVTGIPEGSAATEVSLPIGQLDSTQSRSSGRAGLVQRTGASKTSALQVDVIANAELPIVYSSVEFKEKYGLPGRIAELVADPTHLERWINSVADEVFSGSRAPNIEEFGSLTLAGSGAASDGTGDLWRIKVRFPSHHRQPRTGAAALPDRSSYKVSIRLAKPRSSGARSGTAAHVEHEALFGESEVGTSPGVANL